ETSAALHELARQQVATVEERIAGKKADLQLMADAAAQQKRDQAFQELEPLRQQVSDVRTQVRKEYDALVKQLEKLRDPVEADQLVVLTEQEHREMEDRFGLVFKSGMGAESILSIL